MGFYPSLLFSLLICISSFANISFEEIEKRFTERFGVEVVQLAKQEGVLEARSLDPDEVYQIVEKIESTYWKKLHGFYQSQTLLCLKTKEWQTLFETIHSLPRTIETMSLFFALYKSLKLLETFPSLLDSDYTKYQLSLIRGRLSDLQNMRSVYEFPQAGSYPYVRFLGELVFKHQIHRAKEIGCYEMACMFGIGDVFVPSIYGFFGGQKGMMQPRMLKVIRHHRYYWFTAYRWVQWTDYLPCALGVLLFAMEDMHAGNMYYKPIDNGYFKTGFFDCVGSFIYMDFQGTNPKGDLILYTPYAWVGFDYPQYLYAFQEDEKKKLQKLAQKWTNIRSEIIDYMNSGFCEMFLFDHEKQNQIRRINHMIKTLQKDPKTVEDLHLAFCPDYPVVKEKLYSFFPQYRTMYILFKMGWRPEYTIDKLTPERKQELLDWIANFLQQKQELDF